MSQFIIPIAVAGSFELGCIFERLTQRANMKKRLPYIWECEEPGCNFRVQSSQPTVVVDFADKHALRHQ